MDKKEQIIEVATRLFSERGFENTPISVVCETASVSKGLIFHHFKSKDGLLRAIFAKTTRLIVEINSPEQEAQKQPAKTRLSGLLESFFSQLEADKMFVQLNLNMILQPKTRELLNDLIKERSAFILDSVKSIFDELDPENPLVRSYMFIAELDGIALNYICIFDEYPLAAIKTLMINKYTSQ